MILTEEQEARGLFQNVKAVNAFPNGQGDEGSGGDTEDNEKPDPGNG